MHQAHHVLHGYLQAFLTEETPEAGTTSDLST
jgi:hypothetical protein